MIRDWVETLMAIEGEDNNTGGREAMKGEAFIVE